MFIFKRYIKIKIIDFKLIFRKIATFKKRGEKKYFFNNNKRYLFVKNTFFKVVRQRVQ